MIEPHSTLLEICKETNPIALVLTSPTSPKQTVMGSHNDTKGLTMALNMVKNYPSTTKDIKTFLAEMECAVEATQLPWKHVLLLLGAKTEGRVLKWVHANKPLLTDFPTLRQKMIEHFGPTPSELTAAFQECRLESGEDVRTFHDRFLSTLADLDIDTDNPLAMHNYIQGLGDLGAIVSLSKYRRIEDVRDAAIQLQGFLRRNSQGLPLAGIGALMTQAGNHSSLQAPAKQHGGTGAPPYNKGRDQGRSYSTSMGERNESAPGNGHERRPWGQSGASRTGWNEGAGYPRSGNTDRDQVEQMRRELESMKLQLMQQGRQGAATNMMMMLEDEDPISVYGNNATRPRNMTQLPTFEDVDMGEEGANPRPRRAPPVGPKRAEEVETATTTDVPSEVVHRVLGSRKYVLSLHELLSLSNLGFQQRLADGFNKCCAASPPSQTLNTPTAPRGNVPHPQGVPMVPTPVHYSGQPFAASQPPPPPTRPPTSRAAVPARPATPMRPRVTFADEAPPDEPVPLFRPGSFSQTSHSAASSATPRPTPFRATKKPVHTLQGHQGGSKMIELAVLVNDTPVRAFLDCGAERSVANKTTIASCGLLHQIEDGSGGVVCQGVTGPAVRAIGTVTTVVALNRARTVLDLVVIDNPNASFQLLLGLDWCNIFAAQILFHTRTLVLDLGGGDMMSVRFKTDTQNTASAFYMDVAGTSSHTADTPTPSSGGTLEGPDTPRRAAYQPPPPSEDSFQGGEAPRTSSPTQTANNIPSGPDDDEEYLDWLLSMENLADFDEECMAGMPQFKLIWHEDERAWRRWPDGRRWPEGQDDGTRYDYLSNTLIDSETDLDEESQLLSVAEICAIPDQGPEDEPAEEDQVDKETEANEPINNPPCGINVPGFPEPLRAGNLLPLNKQQQFADMISNARDAFCIHLEDLATPCNIIEAHIDTGNATPVYCNPYRKSPTEEEALAAITRNQLKIGIVEPCVSPWASPAMVVPKKVEEGRDRNKLEVEELWRQVIDYRQLNEKVVPDRMPMPDVQHCLENAARGKVFSRLDLKQGFFQIPLAPESRPKTCFQTVDGTFQFTRLPQGLKTSPAAFVRAVTMALSPVLYSRKSCVVVYFDDIIIHSPSIKQHFKDVEMVLKLLESAGLRAAPHKCVWFESRVKFLGHILEGGTIKPDPSKVRAITDFPTPRSLPQLQSFLGLVNYYQKHYPHFATAAAPLRKLLKKDTPWTWGSEEEAAFQHLKKRAASAPVVMAPDWKRPFILQTDYSAVALAAVLSQKDDSGKEHIVACASRACTGPESRLGATAGELAAVVYGITKFHRYLFGKKFEIITDHSALSYLKRFKDYYSKLARIAIMLQGYDFTITYRQGRHNGNADSLSRVAPIVNDMEEGSLEDRFVDLPLRSSTSSESDSETGESGTASDGTPDGPLSISIFGLFGAQPSNINPAPASEPSPDQASGQQVTPPPSIYSPVFGSLMPETLISPTTTSPLPLAPTNNGEPTEKEATDAVPKGRKEIILDPASTTKGHMLDLTMDNDEAGPSNRPKRKRPEPLTFSGDDDSADEDYEATSTESSGSDDERMDFRGVGGSSGGGTASKYGELASIRARAYQLYSDHNDPSSYSKALTMKDAYTLEYPGRYGLVKRDDEERRKRAPHKDLWLDRENFTAVRTGEQLGKTLRKKLEHWSWDERKQELRYRDRIVPKPEERESIVKTAHELGHRGANGVLEMLGKQYTWPNMKETVASVVHRCRQCSDKGLRIIGDPTLQPLPLPDFLARGALDTFGPLTPPSKYGNKHVVVYVDYYSKFVIAQAIPERSSEHVRKFLRERVFYTLGAPMEIVCDNGTEFKAMMETECRRLNIKITHGAAYHPQTQGQVERTIQTLKQGLKTCMADKEDKTSWEEHLPECVAGMNFARQRSTKFSPYFILYGKHPRLPAGLTVEAMLPVEEPEERIPPSALWNCTPEEVAKIAVELSKRTKQLNKAHTQLCANVQKSQERQIKEYAARRATSATKNLPAIGSKVWVRRYRGSGEGPSTALGQSQWFGPLLLVGYSADKSRGIVQSRAVPEQGIQAENWSESWNDIATKKPTEMDTKKHENEAGPAEP